MKLRLPRILADEDELDREQPVTPARLESAQRPVPAAPPWRWIASVAAVALVPRIVYLFLFADPENAGDGFTDAYHHWQIAYLTREIGLTHGPRLWDLRGWEYYWGLLHPALMSVVFFATGSPDIVLDRLVSVVFGTACVVLIFLLCHRFWGTQVALAAAAFAAFNPASVFNDTAGMPEPLAVALALFGIWLVPARGFWAGVAWGLAAMARVEAWLFGAGLVVAAVIANRSRAAWLVAGWLLTMGIYVKFMWDQTGNPIYPFYWSFLFVGFGAFNSAPVVTTAEQSLGPLMAAATLTSAVGVVWSLWKRPPSYLLLVYGFGYSAYSFATFLIVDAWKERRFELPMDFAAILVAVLLLKLAPARLPRLRILPASVAAAAVIAMQVWWIPIQDAYAATESTYRDHVRLGQAIGAVYRQPEYRGGVIAVPGDEPTLVYTMVRYGAIPGDRFTSEFYDPFYYLPDGYHYADHREVAGTLLQCWLAGTGTRLLLIPPASAFDHSVPDYLGFIADHPDWFANTGPELGHGLRLVAVQVPEPPAPDCRAAQSAAR
ncbi:MAG TPA: hypothetical protein VFL29_12565 [Candidatus Dormibacteraeota bacterium]|nr:hypothetical protein [Candidatus Dormibacteraeota bacterium]